MMKDRIAVDATARCHGLRFYIKCGVVTIPLGTHVLVNDDSFEHK